MFHLQQKSIETRQLATQHKSDLAVSFVPDFSQIIPVIYLTGVGQEIEANLSGLNDEMELQLCTRFINGVSELLLDFEQHFGNERFANYLSKLPSDLMAERDVLFRTLIETATDTSEITKHDLALFEKLHNHNSNFSFGIDVGDKYNFVITSDESFYLYNIDQKEYPEFLHGWLRDYCRSLAGVMGIESLSNSLIAYELERELELLELDTDVSQAQYDAFKSFLDSNLILADQTDPFIIEFLDGMSGYFEEEQQVEALYYAVQLFEVNQMPQEIVYPFNELAIQFEEICAKFPKVKNSALNVIQRQLNVLNRISPMPQLSNDFTDTGDVGVGFTAIFDTHQALNNCPIDIDHLGQSRYDYGECAKLKIELGSDTAIQSLHEYIIAEYFAYQLCNIELFSEIKD